QTVSGIGAQRKQPQQFVFQRHNKTLPLRTEINDRPITASIAELLDIKVLFAQQRISAAGRCANNDFAHEQASSERTAMVTFVRQSPKAIAAAGSLAPSSPDCPRCSLNGGGRSISFAGIDTSFLGFVIYL